MTSAAVLCSCNYLALFIKVRLSLVLQILFFSIWHEFIVVPIICTSCFLTSWTWYYVLNCSFALVLNILLVYCVNVFLDAFVSSRFPGPYVLVSTLFLAIFPSPCFLILSYIVHDLFLLTVYLCRLFHALTFSYMLVGHALYAVQMLDSDLHFRLNQVYFSNAWVQIFFFFVLNCFSSAYDRWS